MAGDDVKEKKPDPTIYKASGWWVGAVESRGGAHCRCWTVGVRDLGAGR